MKAAEEQRAESEKHRAVNARRTWTTVNILPSCLQQPVQASWLRNTSSSPRRSLLVLPSSFSLPLSPGFSIFGSLPFLFNTAVPLPSSLWERDRDPRPPSQLEIMSYPNLPAFTPQKPLPGAFVHTPAPANARNGPLFPQKQAPPTPAQPAPVSLPNLPPAASKTKDQSLSTEERAAHTINDTLAHEARYPDLDTYLSRKSMASCMVGSICELTQFVQRACRPTMTSQVPHHGLRSRK